MPRYEARFFAIENSISKAFLFYRIQFDAKNKTELVKKIHRRFRNVEQLAIHEKKGRYKT